MPYKPVDTAIKIIVGPLIDDADFKAREESIAYNAAGMEIDVIVEKADGSVVTTAVVPTTGGGNYDWAHTDQGYYELKLPASGGASFNNTEEGVLTVVGYCDGVLPFRSVSYDVVPKNVYATKTQADSLLETFYPGNTVYVDATNGTSGTTSFTHGTIDTPCTTFAEALTIAAALKLTRIKVQDASAYVVTSDLSAGYRIEGNNQAADLDFQGGNDISNCEIVNFNIQGDPVFSAGGNKRPIFEDCIMGDNGALVLCPARYVMCALEGTLTLGSTGAYEFNDCFDARATASFGSLTLDFNSLGGAHVIMSEYNCNMTIKNMAASDSFRIQGTGYLNIDNTNAGGDADISGDVYVIDGLGGVTVNDRTTLGSVGISRNRPLNNFEFDLVLSSDHISPSLGATVTAQRSIDGGAYAACTNAVTEVGNGTYKINLTAADLNGDVITLKFSAAATDTRKITVKTIPATP